VLLDPEIELRLKNVVQELRLLINNLQCILTSYIFTLEKYNLIKCYMNSNINSFYIFKHEFCPLVLDRLQSFFASWFMLSRIHLLLIFVEICLVCGGIQWSVAFYINCFQIESGLGGANSVLNSKVFLVWLSLSSSLVLKKHTFHLSLLIKLSNLLIKLFMQVTLLEIIFALLELHYDCCEAGDI